MRHAGLDLTGNFQVVDPQTAGPGTGVHVENDPVDIGFTGIDVRTELAPQHAHAALDLEGDVGDLEALPAISAQGPGSITQGSSSRRWPGEVSDAA